MRLLPIPIRALVRVAILTILLAIPCALTRAEEPGTFTQSTGVTLAEAPTCTKETTQSVGIRKAKAGHEVLVRAFFNCDGSFAEPWLPPSVGSGTTLVLQKQRKSGMGFSSNCECLYNLRVLIPSGRLQPKDTLYVVNERVVVGHVKVP